MGVYPILYSREEELRWPQLEPVSAAFLPGILSNPQDGGDTFFRNVKTLSELHGDATQKPTVLT
jgi:hypothetical protein